MVAGRDILEKGDRDAFELLSAQLLAIASRARDDFYTFFEFVMEEENTKVPIVILPHQRVAAEFLLAHRRAVLMMPRGHSKSFLIMALVMWHIGRDPNFRGAIVSATEGQAEKTVMAIRQYIESNPRLRLVFPQLCPTSRKGEPWTQTAITVQRPAGTRDPTLVARGMDGPVRGSRLKVIVVDDILTEENTATNEQRQKVIMWVEGALLGTLDKPQADTRVYFVGTAAHPEDLMHKASEPQRGWATLKMDIVGNIVTIDDKDPGVRIDGADSWETPLLRLGPNPYERLVAHDPDDHNEKLLWPSKFEDPKRPGQMCRANDVLSQQLALSRFKRGMHPTVFQKEYMMVAKDEEAAWFRMEWFEQCKAKAREMGFFKLAEEYTGEYPTFTGVDLGINIGEHNDDTAFFTFCVLPSGHRLLLDIDAGKFDSARKLRKVHEKVTKYKSWLVMVESNGGQKFIVDWALDQQVDLPVRAFQTTAMKAHVELGIPGLATEVYNGAWLIPNDEEGVCDERVQRWISECVNYVPDKHTGDVLMASYFAQQGARQWGIGTGSQTSNAGASGLGDFMSR